VKKLPGLNLFVSVKLSSRALKDATACPWIGVFWWSQFVALKLFCFT